MMLIVPPPPKELELFLREGHLMLWDKGTAELKGKSISALLKQLFNTRQFREMTEDEMNCALRARLLSEPIQAREFCYRCLNKPPKLKQLRPMVGIDKILDIEEIKQMNESDKIQLFDQFATMMANRFEVRVQDFPSLAAIGQEIMQQAECYAGVEEMTGPLSEFIRKCQAPILCGPAEGKPVKVEGSIVQVDRRGSYCAVYSQFQGIPKGAPKLMTSFLPAIWSYFYVCVNVISWKPRPVDPFPLLNKVGLMWLDKVMFDAICERYEWEWEWKSGYGFNEGFNTNICKLSKSLWKLRQQLKEAHSPLQGVVKRMINSLFGKSIQKGEYTYTRDVHVLRLESTLRRNRGYVFSVKPIPDSSDERKVRFVKTICAPYIRPQFGVNVLSFSRVGMQKMIDRAISLEHQVYYSNTDCLVMTAEGAEATVGRIGMMGMKLGQFVHELPKPARKFICLSARKYIFCFDNLEPKVRFGPNDDQDPKAYFEWLFAQAQ
jgi:hypothetical protein